MDDWQPVAHDDWQPVGKKSKAVTSDILPFGRDENGNFILKVPSILKGAEQGGQSLWDTKPQTTISDSDVGPLTAGSALQGAALLNPMAPKFASAPKMIPAPKPTLAETKGAAEAVYQNPDNLNKVIPPAPLQDVAERAAQGSAKDHPAVNDIVNEMRAATDSGMPDLPKGVTARELDNWSSRLGKLAGETQPGPNFTSTATPKAQAAAALKPQIDELLASHIPEWKVADQNWKAFRTAEGLDKKSNIAQIKSESSGASYADRIKSNATQMLTNPRIDSFLSAAQKAQLKKISTGTIPEKALTGLADVFGNRVKIGVGTAGGFMAGGIPGAVAGKVADTAIAKSIVGVRNSVANRRAKNLIASILAGSPHAKGRALVPVAVNPRRAAIARALLSVQQPLSTNLVPSYAGYNQP